MYDALTANGQGAPEPETKSVPASLPSVDPSRGAPHGKVTVHEWADFQCVFCARAEPTVVRLLKDYGTKIKFVAYRTTETRLFYTDEHNHESSIPLSSIDLDRTQQLNAEEHPPLILPGMTVQPPARGSDHGSR